MRAVTLFTSALVLAACSNSAVDADSDGDGELTSEEATRAVDRMVRPEPGQYRTTLELVAVEAPDASERDRAAFEAMAARGPQIGEFCLTEDAASNGVLASLQMPSLSAGKCINQSFNTSGDSFTASMECAEGPGLTSRVSVEGTGGRTASQATIKAELSARDGSTMIMKSRFSQQRIGECSNLPAQ